jgi:hypothetical protein
MLESLVVILAAIIGYAFLRSQGEGVGGLGIRFQPHPNTPEGRRKRTRGIVVIVAVFGAISYVYLYSQNRNPVGFVLIILSAMIVVFLSVKKSKK